MGPHQDKKQGEQRIFKAKQEKKTLKWDGGDTETKNQKQSKQWEPPETTGQYIKAQVININDNTETAPQQYVQNMADSLTLSKICWFSIKQIRWGHIS